MTKQILSTVNGLFKNDGIHNTFLDNIKIFSSSQYDSLTPSIIDNCMVFVLQGSKISKVGENTLVFDIKNYLVAPTILPFECETFASKEEPFIALIININKTLMYEVISSMLKYKSIESTENTIGVFSDTVTEEIEELLLRLLKILKSKEESFVLGESLLKELFYRVINGKKSSFLYKFFIDNNVESKIIRTLKVIHTDFQTNLDISTLARKEDMSVASFHTHFKILTSHTPLQYIKKVRLNKAKDLLSIKIHKVHEVANMIGYDNSSQFSRDFKSYFGYSPTNIKSFVEENNIRN